MGKEIDKYIERQLRLLSPTTLISSSESQFWVYSCRELTWALQMLLPHFYHSFCMFFLCVNVGSSLIFLLLFQDVLNLEITTSLCVTMIILSSPLLQIFFTCSSVVALVAHHIHKNDSNLQKSQFPFLYLGQRVFISIFGGNKGVLNSAFLFTNLFLPFSF